MEDILQILFILIFIIGSIASSFKKNKKRREQANTQPSIKPDVNTSENKAPKSNAQMIEELLGLKVEMQEPQNIEVPVNYSESITTDSTWDPAKDFGEEKKEINLQSYEEKKAQKKREFKIEELKHRAIKKDIIVPIKQKRKTNYKNLLSNTNTLKKYIIAQELLNKPKSLRR